MDIALLLSAAQACPPEHSSHSNDSSALTRASNPTASAQTEYGKEQGISHTQDFIRKSQSIHPLPPISRLTSPLLAATAAAAALSLNPTGPSCGRVEKQAPKPFRCTYQGCGATFGQKGSLTRHIRSRHEKLRPHSCDLCQKSFSALWTLRVHQRNVHLKSKPHKCHLCDKSFGELFNKSKHIAIVHQGKRPFSCPICSRAFGYKGDMRKHVLELHEQTGRPFQCIIPSCGVKFARKRYLRRHENLSHKGHPLLANREVCGPTDQPTTDMSLTFVQESTAQSKSTVSKDCFHNERSSVSRSSDETISNDVHTRESVPSPTGSARSSVVLSQSVEA